MRSVFVLVEWSNWTQTIIDIIMIFPEQTDVQKYLTEIGAKHFSQEFVSQGEQWIFRGHIYKIFERNFKEITP